MLFNNKERLEELACKIAEILALRNRNEEILRRLRRKIDALFLSKLGYDVAILPGSEADDILKAIMNQINKVLREGSPEAFYVYDFIAFKIGKYLYVKQGKEMWNGNKAKSPKRHLHLRVSRGQEVNYGSRERSFL
jgi:hypothetical protein